MTDAARRWPDRDPTDLTDVAVAVHEAAHAVALTVGGIGWTHAELRHPGTGGGHVTYLVSAAHARPLPFVVAALAGATAAAIYTGADPIEALLAQGTDLARIDAATGGLTATAVAACLRRAVLLVTTTHRDAVCAVAAALLDAPGQRLDWTTVEQIVDDTTPGGVGHLLRHARAAITGHDRNP